MTSNNIPAIPWFLVRSLQPGPNWEPLRPLTLAGMLEHSGPRSPSLSWTPSDSEGRERKKRPLDKGFRKLHCGVWRMRRNTRTVYKCVQCNTLDSLDFLQAFAREERMTTRRLFDMMIWLVGLVGVPLSRASRCLVYLGLPREGGGVLILPGDVLKGSTRGRGHNHG